MLRYKVVHIHRAGSFLIKLALYQDGLHFVLQAEILWHGLVMPVS